MLDDLGLVTALRAYVEEWSARTRIPLAFDASLPADRHVPAATEIAIYRMVQEALSNVAKHAGATRVAVSLHVDGDVLLVEVRDNGKGMAPTTRRADHLPESVRGPGVPRPGTEPPAVHGAPTGRSTVPGLGLFTMQERIGLAGGVFEIDSSQGGGTAVRARIPLTTTSLAQPRQPRPLMRTGRPGLDAAEGLPTGGPVPEDTRLDGPSPEVT
jgi:signal transduction histidine kinase